MNTLIDQDIAHIARIMRPSLHGDASGPVLPASYWRNRLHHLLDAWHVTKAQLCVIDRLLLELDHYDRDQARPATSDTALCPAASATPASRPSTHKRRNACAA